MLKMNLSGTIEIDSTRVVEFSHSDELVVIKKLRKRDGATREIELDEDEARLLLHYLSMIFRGELEPKWNVGIDPGSPSGSWTPRS